MYKIDIRYLHSGDVASNSSRVHAQAYTCLQHIVQEHTVKNITPFLSESPRPLGRYKNIKMQGRALLDLIQDNTEFVQIQSNQDFIQNIEGMLVIEQENPNLFKDLKSTDIL